ncbi:MAG: hypothetical protein LUE92_00935 [Clostridiales bacterium]|nr:hypothetical protein [Clostridiales bacterium]
MRKMIETVRGSVATSDMGKTLMHDHVFSVDNDVLRDQPSLSLGSDPQKTVSLVIERLRKVADSGIRTYVDQSILLLGRNIPLLKQVNEGVNLNIVVSTGIYTKDVLPDYFHFRPREKGKRDILTEFFVRDLTEGIAGTGVKAGLLKGVTDKQGVTPDVERTLRAVAQAHRETGIPIATHSVMANHSGLDQLRIFKEEGVDPSHVLIGHCGDAPDYDCLREIMDQGAMIGADRFGMNMPGMPTLDGRIEIVAKLCREGYADRIVFGHDAQAYMDYYSPALKAYGLGEDYWKQTVVMEEAVPGLLKAGVTQEQIDQMLISNPRRFFENE